MSPDEERAEALFRTLLAGRLPDEPFDHRAHLLVGWQLVRTRPFHRSVDAMQLALETVTAAQGIEGKYDPRLTRSWMVRLAGASDGSDSFESFLEQNPTLLGAP